MRARGRVDGREVEVVLPASVAEAVKLRPGDVSFVERPDPVGLCPRRARDESYSPGVCPCRPSDNVCTWPYC